MYFQKSERRFAICNDCDLFKEANGHSKGLAYQMTRDMDQRHWVEFFEDKWHNVVLQVTNLKVMPDTCPLPKAAATSITASQGARPPEEPRWNLPQEATTAASQVTHSPTEHLCGVDAYSCRAGETHENSGLSALPKAEAVAASRRTSACRPDAHSIEEGAVHGNLGPSAAGAISSLTPHPNPLLNQNSTEKPDGAHTLKRSQPTVSSDLDVKRILKAEKKLGLRT